MRIFISVSMLAASTLAYALPAFALFVPENVYVLLLICTCVGAMATLLSLALAIRMNTGLRGKLSPPRTLGALVSIVLLVPTAGFFVGLVANMPSIFSMLEVSKTLQGTAVTFKSGRTAILTGWIGPKTVSSLQDLVRERSINRLVLSSPGGRIDSAIEIADYLRLNNISRVNISSCESACVIIALAGPPLYASPDAVFGFHQGSATAAQDSQYGRFIGKYATHDLLDALHERGAPQSVLELAQKTPYDEMAYLTGQEMFNLGLVARLVSSD